MSKDNISSMPMYDPLLFLVDDEIKKFQIDKRWDLTGTGAQKTPVLADGLFIVHEHVVPEGTAEIISDVFPHCWKRTAVGAVDPSFPEESWQLMAPAEVAGWVLFDSGKDNNQPQNEISNDYNPSNVFATPNNTGRKMLRGTTWLSDNQPQMSAIGLRNPLGMFYLPPKSVFRVTFQLIPQLTSAQGAVPNQLVIGDPGSNNKRIDGAGACVSGVRMPSTTYEKLRTARRAGLI